MKAARWIYAIAALYGIIALVPQFFLEGAAAEASPLGAVSHPEFYYGFIGTALAWQAAFLVIAWNPVRFRALMPVTFLEKIAFAVPAGVLYLEGRVSEPVLIGGAIDAVLLVAFIIAYVKTPKDA